MSLRRVDGAQDAPRKNGYEVLEASGVDEGLKLFVSRNVHAVVVGDQMPGTMPGPTSYLHPFPITRLGEGELHGY
jgi:hypothetical protein